MGLKVGDVCVVLYFIKLEAEVISLSLCLSAVRTQCLSFTLPGWLTFMVHDCTPRVMVMGHCQLCFNLFCSTHGLWRTSNADVV